MTEHSALAPACAYYINLDSRTDRNLHMQTLLLKSKWHFERVAATRLKEHPVDLGIPLADAARSKPHVASIFLSHKSALEKIMNFAGDGVFLVLEDDVSIDFDSTGNLSFLPINIGNDWEMGLVSTRFKRKLNKGNWEWILSPLEFNAIPFSQISKDLIVTGAHFCVFNGKKSAGKILDRMKDTKIIYDVDTWYLDHTECYVWRDHHVGTANYGSDHFGEIPIDS